MSGECLVSEDRGQKDVSTSTLNFLKDQGTVRELTKDTNSIVTHFVSSYNTAIISPQLQMFKPKEPFTFGFLVLSVNSTIVILRKIIYNHLSLIYFV